LPSMRYSETLAAPHSRDAFCATASSMSRLETVLTLSPFQSGE
jgi:hypothetical protein